MKKNINIPRDEEFEIIDGLFVYGDFEVELFYKNFGTFREDLSIRSNFDCICLYIDGKAQNFESLDYKYKEDIRNYIVEIAIRSFDSRYLDM